MNVLHPAAAPSATIVHSWIEDAMYRVVREQLRGIDVAVVGRDVWLTGTTTAMTAREQAELAAWSVPGVDNVINEIRVIA
jgi:osmotically-inducible protein OsmY